VFILHVLAFAFWRRFVGGGCVAGYWNEGSRFFTTPAWHMASRAMHVSRKRLDLGPYESHVVDVHSPPTCARNATSQPWHTPLPRLNAGISRYGLLIHALDAIRCCVRAAPHGFARVVHSSLCVWTALSREWKHLLNGYLRLGAWDWELTVPTWCG
jgi:hypothetical protein